jgi:hypothetical protein
MVDLDSVPDLLQWDRHGLLTRAAQVGAEPPRQDAGRWGGWLPATAVSAMRNGARLILELPPELQGIGAVACNLTAELTGLHPILWHPDQPVVPSAHSVVWLTALPAIFAASAPSGRAAFTSALPLDISDQVRFADHPALTLMRLLDLFASFLPPVAAHRLLSSATPTWPVGCSLDVPVVGNPAKQLAVRLSDRIPIIWGNGIMAGVAADWTVRHLWYADSMAFTASPLHLARIYSLGRLPRFWPNAAAIVRLQDGAASSLMDDELQRIFARRRFTILDVSPTPELSVLDSILYLLALGEWAALYTAALTESDPLEHTPLTILFGDERPRS